MDNSQIFFWISLISLLLLIASGAAAFGQTHTLGKEYKLFWTISAIKEMEFLFPVSINYIILYILFGILLLYSILSCVFLFLNRNESNFLDGMFGPLSKFHFIPLLCASSLYIIGECFTEENNNKDAPYIFSLIFSVIGLGCLILVYRKTDLSSSPTYVRLIIKKGLYPCLIALFVYNICYTFGDYGYIRKAKNGDWDSLDDWAKGCSIAFSIIIGIINLFLAFILNDICLFVMNIIIYIGLIICFFNLSKDVRSKMNGVAEGIIEIVIEVLSLSIMVFKIYKYKAEILG